MRAVCGRGVGRRLALRAARAYARAEMAATVGHERQEDREKGAARDQRASSAVRHPAEELARMIGNRAFTQVIGRSGAGILPDGRAHPAVETAIGGARGSGGGLDHQVRSPFSPRLGDDLKDVRVHTDSPADALARSVSARAFVTGRDMFFAEGQYRPATPDGDKLIAHELTHVVQQRGAAASGPLRVSQPSDALERDADRTAHELLT